MTIASRKVGYVAALIAIFVLAIVIRLRFLAINGGDAADQLAWAKENHFGGITEFYLVMRDRIFRGLSEAKMWPYLPGYPALLALLDVMGVKDLHNVRIAQSVIDAAAIFPFAYLIRRLTNSLWISATAALVYASGQWWAQGSSYLVAEALMPALVICVLAGMVVIRDRSDDLAGLAVLGFASAALPFFRTEAILLLIPLMTWALMVSPRRVLAASVVGLAFAAPLLAWALRNYAMHGVLALTPPVGWYSLWSGLGQVENNAGYFVSDIRAGELLASKGIVFHTPEAEQFWRSQYLAALFENPSHVLRAVVFRFRYIAKTCDYDGPQEMCRLVYSWFGPTTALAFGILIWVRRRGDALLVIGPLTFAVFSLGLTYVEPRYVRYAALTYVMGAAVFASSFGRYIIFRRDGVENDIR